MRVKFGVTGRSVGATCCRAEHVPRLLASFLMSNIILTLPSTSLPFTGSILFLSLSHTHTSVETHIWTQMITCINAHKDETHTHTLYYKRHARGRSLPPPRTPSNTEPPLCPGSSSSSQLTSAIIWGPSSSGAASECN